jgi:hypothetical protein
VRRHQLFDLIIWRGEWLMVYRNWLIGARVHRLQGDLGQATRKARILKDKRDFYRGDDLRCLANDVAVFQSLIPGLALGLWLLVRFAHQGN